MEAKNAGFPNGNPNRNCFAQWGTPGTETSQYRQEKKPTEMSLVTASERDVAQTEAFGQCGVLGRHASSDPAREVPWNGARYRVKAP